MHFTYSLLSVDETHFAEKESSWANGNEGGLLFSGTVHLHLIEYRTHNPRYAQLSHRK